MREQSAHDAATSDADDLSPCPPRHRPVNIRRGLCARGTEICVRGSDACELDRRDPARAT